MSLVPVFHGTVDAAGKLALTPPIKGLLTRHLLTLKDQPVTVTVRIYRKQRTDRQGRYYFGVVVALIADHCGYEKDEMHEVLAMRFLRIADCPVTGSPRRKHTPDTDTKEFSEYVDQCVRFGAELGVYIPDPHQVEA